MSFSCYLQLDTRRKKKNDLYPVIIRITVNRNSTSFKTNIALHHNEWDEKHLKIRSTAKSVHNTVRLNKYLNHCLTQAESLLFNLSESHELGELTLKGIKERISIAIEGKSSPLTIESLIEAHINKLNKEKRFGYARTFDDLRKFLVKYSGTSEIPISGLNFKWLDNIESDYKAQGNGLNGLSVRLRALRTLINHNKKTGLLDVDFNPFSNYTIKSEKTRKRALTKDDFEKIVTADATTLNQSMNKARNYFLISYYLLGISFHDLALLQVKSIQDGKIYYKRAKTKRLYAIKISSKLESLLAEYLNDKEADDYLLPILKKGINELAQKKRIQNAIGRYNKHLKEMAIQLGIKSQNMSSYVARHSLATHARDVSKIEIPIISQMLGHNDVSTTAIYLASIEDSVMDEAVDRMFE